MRVAVHLHHVPVGMLRAVLDILCAERTLELHNHIAALIFVRLVEVNYQFQVVGIALDGDVAVEDCCESVLVEHRIAAVLVEHVGVGCILDTDACREGVSLSVLSVVEEAHAGNLDALHLLHHLLVLVGSHPVG